MDTIKFSLYCMKRGIRVKPVNPDLLQRYKTLADLTAEIDFGCGKCTHGERRCCGACKIYVGHMHGQPIHEGDLAVYAAAFDGTTGFWTSKGCALPRHMRSATCLTHHCGARLRSHEKEIGHELHYVAGLMGGE